MPRAALVSRRGVPWQVRHRPPPPAARRGMRDGPTSRVSSRARGRRAVELEQEHLPLDARGACHRSPTPRLPLPPVALWIVRGCPAWRLKGGGAGMYHLNIGQTYLLDLACHETVTRNRTTSPSHLACSHRTTSRLVCVCVACVGSLVSVGTRGATRPQSLHGLRQRRRQCLVPRRAQARLRPPLGSTRP